MGIRIFSDRNLQKAQNLFVLETDCRASLYALAHNDRLLQPLQTVFQAAAQPLERAAQGTGDGGFVDAQLLGDL